jgi:hypothetical protein
MKKAGLVAVILAALTVWMIVVFSADDTSGMREWPFGLGTLDSVPRRYPELTPHAPLPDLRSRMRRARELTARGTWEDLRAAHGISRELWSQRPDLVTAIVAMAIDQEIADAAKRLPGPLPPWLEELRAFDHPRALVAAVQTDTWKTGVVLRDIAHSDDAGQNWVRRAVDRTFMTPYLDASRAEFVEHQRRIAYGIATGNCRFGEPPWWNRSGRIVAPNLTAVCRKLTRLRADLDALKRAP